MLQAAYGVCCEFPAWQHWETLSRMAPAIHRIHVRFTAHLAFIIHVLPRVDAYSLITGLCEQLQRCGGCVAINKSPCVIWTLNHFSSLSSGAMHCVSVSAPVWDVLLPFTRACAADNDCDARFVAIRPFISSTQCCQHHKQWIRCIC